MELERKDLTRTERTWLEALLLKFNRGETPSIRKLIVELRAKIPADFDPANIDEQLARNGQEITLYGIWLVDPQSQWLNIVSRVISQIKHLLLVAPDRESILSDEVAKGLELDKKLITMAFGLLTPLGFVTAVQMDERMGTMAVRIDTPEAFRKFVFFQTIEDALADFVSEHATRRRTPKSEAAVSVPSTMKMDRGVKSIADTALILLWMKGPSDRDSFEVGESIANVCQEFGVQTSRADEIEQAGRVSEVIIRTMLESEILIADLTDFRPELFYEIGYAHALGKRPILVRKKGTPIPFQLTGYVIDEYDTMVGLTDLLRMRLAAMLGVRRMFSKH